MREGGACLARLPLRRTAPSLAPSGSGPPNRQPTACQSSSGGIPHPRGTGYWGAGGGREGDRLPPPPGETGGRLPLLGKFPCARMDLHPHRLAHWHRDGNNTLASAHLGILGTGGGGLRCQWHGLLAPLFRPGKDHASFHEHGIPFPQHAYRWCTQSTHVHTLMHGDIQKRMQPPVTLALH